MMIWVHGFLMPERGETETRIFFLMGTDPWIDGSIDRWIDRSAKQQKQKSGPEGPQENSIFRPSVAAVCDETYACGEVVGLALGGHGVPGVGFIPGELLPLPLPWFPGAEGFELDDPVLGSAPGVPFAVPGKGPHGEPLGAVPGVVVVLGFTVEGCVVLPGVGLFGELEPGAVVFGVPLGEPDPGAVCGVVDPVGGLTLPVGGAVERGAELCRALLEPPAGAAPPGELWATAQLAQHNTTDSKVSLGNDIFQILQTF